jgi:hypothetical protein
MRARPVGRWVTAEKKTDGTASWTMLAHLFFTSRPLRPRPWRSARWFTPIWRIEHWRKTFESLLSDAKRLASETPDSEVL